MQCQEIPGTMYRPVENALGSEILVDTKLLFTDQKFIHWDIVESIALGIIAEDDIPTINVVSPKDLGRRLNDEKEWQEISEGLIIYNGNHRARAYSYLEMPAKVAVITDPSSIRLYREVYWGNRLKPISNIAVWRGKGELERRIADGGFYRRID